MGGQLFPIPPPVFENLIPPSFAIMMMLSEKKIKKSTVVLGFQRGLSISGGEFAKTQTAGMEPKCPLVKKSARIDLKLSGQGNYFGVGITNTPSELPNSISLTRYRVAHSCMFLLQIREKIAKKKYPVFLAPLLALLSTREGC